MTITEKEDIQYKYLYGKRREDIVFDRIRHNIVGLSRSNKKYAPFDYYLTNGKMLFEIKSSQSSRIGYYYAIMKKSKIATYNHVVLLFEYYSDKLTATADERVLFYHIYDPDRKYRTEYTKSENRLGEQEVIYIPMTDLIQFDYNIEYIFDTENITTEDTEIFNDLIKKHG